MNPSAALTGNLIEARSYENGPEMRLTATEQDIDELGHVNNAVYLVWAQSIAVAHWRAVASDALIQKYVWVALRHEIDYRDQLFPGDEVVMRTWLGEVAGPRYQRFVDIRREGSKRAAANILTSWCLIDAETRKPKRVGSEILKPFGFS